MYHSVDSPDILGVELNSHSEVREKDRGLYPVTLQFQETTKVFTFLRCRDLRERIRGFFFRLFFALSLISFFSLRLPSVLTLPRCFLFPLYLFLLILGPFFSIHDFLYVSLFVYVSLSSLHSPIRSEWSGYVFCAFTHKLP